MSKTIKKHKVLFIILLIIVLAATGGIIFFNRSKNDTSKTGKIKNNVVELSKRNLSKSISATGTIESAKERTISSSATNITVKKVNVKVGDEVKKGDSLISFDKSDLEDALTDAKENLSNTKSDNSRSLASANRQLSDSKSTYSSDKSTLTSDIKKAKKTLTKAKNSLASLKKQLKNAKDAAAKKELEEQITKAEETVTQAQNSYDTAVTQKNNTNKQNKSSIENAEDNVANTKSSNEKSLKEAQEKVDEASKALDQCAVTSNISGVVTAVNVEEGDTYTGGDLVTIDDTSSFTVSTTVDEYDISDVAVGQKVTITTEATDDEEINGEITFVAPSTNSSSSSSTETNNSASMMGSTSNSSDGYEVTIDITDSNDKLRMGLTAKCNIILDEANDVFAVPYDAIHKNTDGNNVIYVTSDKDNTDTYDEITVTTGIESDYYTEISGTDLEEGMYVIIPTDETEEASDSNNENNMPGGNFQGGGNGTPPDGMGKSGRGNRGNGPMGGANN